MNNWDPKKLAADLVWLQDHPWFNEKPASITEFLGPGYLNIADKVRPGVKEELVILFGEEVNGHRIALFKWAMFTGAIGIGKTTMASIVIPYMCHWVLCLKDPQDFYELLPGSKIAFMQMSTSEDQATETVFGDIKSRIQYCEWFQNNFPFDTKFTKQLRFEKDIWVLPGSSAETSFEGYNILGGILDEADSHKKTKDKDYAEEGWNTINSRIESRYDDKGFLLTIGQMKSASGFAAAKYKELCNDPVNAHTVRMTIWGSRGWHRHLKPDGTRDSFWYDVQRKTIISAEAARILGGESEVVLEIPTTYMKGFLNNPEKALRDLAGIPPKAGSSFISLTYRLDEARDRWKKRYELETPVDPNPTTPVMADWFKALDSIKRVGHLDIAYSDNGDSAGIALGHISKLVMIEDEEKPYIIIDALFRIRAPQGNQIMLSDLRRIFYELKDERHFKIAKVTMDGFQSVDTEQQLRKKKFNPEYLSVDKNKAPYEDLRDAIYESRIEWPEYVTHLNPADTETVEILYKELSELEDTGKKIDHPVKGSKDVADCVAGVTHTLMGDRTYRRGVKSDRERERMTEDEIRALMQDTRGSANSNFGAGMGGSGLQAPIPPSMSSTGLMGVPKSLQPRKGR